MPSRWIAAFLFCVSLVFNMSLLSAEDSFLEISPGATFETGDVLRSSTLGSLSATYHFNNTFWLGIDFMGGALVVDRGNGLGVRDGEKHFLLNGAFYWNLPSLLGLSMKLPADFYTSIGAGNFWADKKTEPYGFIGGGLIINTSLWYLTPRFDLKNLFYVLNNSQGGDFNSDLMLTLGLSFRV